MTGERNLPGLGLRGFFTAGTGGWGDPRSEDLRLVSALANMTAISRSTSLPPSGNLGDIYIVPTADLNGDDVAVWDGEVGLEAWNYYTPTGAWLMYLQDEATTVQWDGAAWAAFAGGTGGGGGGGISTNYMHCRDEKLDTTNGGTPPAVDAWFARELTATLENSISGASLAANQIDLPAGSFRFRASAPNHQGNHHKLRLQNVTDAVTLLEGANAFSENAANLTTRAVVAGAFTLAVGAKVELQHIVNVAQPNIGLGVNVGTVFTAPIVEVYAEIEIWQFLDTGVFYSVEVLATGTDAGDSVPGRNIRAFNFDLENTIAGASRTGAVFTLPAGLYECRAHAPAFDSDGHGLRLFDIDSAADLVKGGNEHSGAQKQNTANLDGPFTLAVETQVRLEHYCENGKAGTGLGQAINEAGELERYSGIRFLKLS